MTEVQEKPVLLTVYEWHMLLKELERGMSFLNIDTTPAVLLYEKVATQLSDMPIKVRQHHDEVECWAGTGVKPRQNIRSNKRKERNMKTNTVQKVLGGMIVLLAILAWSILVYQKVMPEPAAPVPTEKPLRIAVQFGLGYAPLAIAQDQGYFERYAGVEVEWKQYGSGGAIREALVAGELDIGFMGIPPFIIGWDKGAPWRVMTGLCVMPLGLQTYKDDIQSLADFGPDDKIAYPSPGSIQHILLSMAAEKELGDATALDDLGVAMKHPDGAAALLSEKDITAHFTSPPYIFKELEGENIHQVVSGADAFGTDFTFIVGVATNDFYNTRPEVYAGAVVAIAEAVTFINTHPTPAAAILAPTFKLDEATTLKYMTWPGVNYVTTPYGLMGFADFMKAAGYIEKVPTSINDLVWPNVAATVGQKSREMSAIEALQLRP